MKKIKCKINFRSIFEHLKLKKLIEKISLIATII